LIVLSKLPDINFGIFDLLDDVEVVEMERRGVAVRPESLERMFDNEGRAPYWSIVIIDCDGGKTG
jgi:hypothetical protein